MSDFLLNHSQTDTAREIFADIFDDDTSIFNDILEELINTAASWNEPKHIKRDTIVFATLVPPAHNAFGMAYPLSDISKIKIDDIPVIPDYMRYHDFTDAVEEIDHCEFMRFARPLLLTPSYKLMTYWAYILESEPLYEAAMLAGIVYEMSLLGTSIKVSDKRKEELEDELIYVREKDGLDMSLEELLIEAGLAQDRVNTFSNGNLLDSFYLSRYNARLAMYERLHFDIVSNRAESIV